jgi:hypothetical protein
VFVEVTETDATASSWLIANVGRCLPGDYEFAFDVELDAAAIRCVGMEWWTTDSQPADGPAPDVRRLWRFDVSDALSLTPVASLVPDDDPGVPREAIEALQS